MSSAAQPTITAATSDRDLAEVRHLFGAYQRAVATFADEAEICA
jgi:hypothetical protein